MVAKKTRTAMFYNIVFINFLNISILSDLPQVFLTWFYSESFFIYYLHNQVS